MSRDARILLCDDEYPILRAAEFKLKRAGYEVVCGNDGQEGWESIQQQRPDLLVTDYQMPRMNGLELCERVRSDPRSHDLPIVMLTAKGFELSLDDIRRDHGVIALLSKPFSPRELLQLVDDILEQEQQAVAPVSPQAPSMAAHEANEVLP